MQEGFIYDSDSELAHNEWRSGLRKDSGAPNKSVFDNDRCAAANATSIASLAGISKNNLVGQALLGNDVATLSNLLFGPGRLSAAGQAAFSVP